MPVGFLGTSDWLLYETQRWARGSIGLIQHNCFYISMREHSFNPKSILNEVAKYKSCSKVQISIKHIKIYEVILLATLTV